MSDARGLLPTDVDTAIEDAILESRLALDEIAEDSLEDSGPPARLPLAIKYVPSRFAQMYQVQPNDGFFIGDKNFTWGNGVYVTSVAQPVSTAIYGRSGVVARFDPSGWRVFDARDVAQQALYLRWLSLQTNYADALLTVHSDYRLHEFRNGFREAFHIDCVLFHPDEQDNRNWYTSSSDTWLAVSDWAGAQLKAGYSDRFFDARLTIVVEDEFVADVPALTRSPQFALSGGAPQLPSSALVKQAFANRAIIRIES